MRILVIEDDEIMADGLRLMLHSVGMTADLAPTGEEALEFISSYPYDLIILDLILPGHLDGYGILEKLRQQKFSTPVLILSGLGALDSKLRSFSIGADDYLVKPFQKEELVARIHALVRRSQGLTQSLIEVGDLVINMDMRSVAVSNIPVQLTRKEYNILELLALRRGTVITKESFLNYLYNGFDEPEIKIIDVFICKLRRKLSEIGEMIIFKLSGDMVICSRILAKKNKSAKLRSLLSKHVLNSARILAAFVSASFFRTLFSCGGLFAYYRWTISRQTSFFPTFGSFSHSSNFRLCTRKLIQHPNRWKTSPPPPTTNPLARYFRWLRYGWSGSFL